jgi:hypothetical protein
MIWNFLQSSRVGPCRQFIVEEAPEIYEQRMPKMEKRNDDFDSIEIP